MSQICELTGKRPNFGNTRSHANNKTRTRWELNLKAKKYFIPELGRAMRFMLSTRAIRTVDRYANFTAALMKAHEGGLSERLLKIRKKIHSSRVEAAMPKPNKAPKTKRAKKA